MNTILAAWIDVSSPDALQASFYKIAAALVGLALVLWVLSMARDDKKRKDHKEMLAVVIFGGFALFIIGGGWAIAAGFFDGLVGTSPTPSVTTTTGG